MMLPTRSVSTFGSLILFAPDDPLKPPGDHFAEPWQATVLAMATAMIREGHFTQDDWATALGHALKEAEETGKPDTDETYFLSALTALETLSETTGITAATRAARKLGWESAYRRTPHGQPVTLD